MASNWKIIFLCATLLFTACGPSSESADERADSEKNRADSREADRIREKYRDLKIRYEALAGVYHGTMLGRTGVTSLAILNIWVSKEVIAVPGVTEPIESTSLRATLDFYSQDEDPSKALPLGVFTSGSYLPDTGSFGLQGGNISLSGQFENGVIDAIVSAPFSSTELHVERMSSY